MQNFLSANSERNIFLIKLKLVQSTYLSGVFNCTILVLLSYYFQNRVHLKNPMSVGFFMLLYNIGGRCKALVFLKSCVSGKLVS